MTELSYLVLLNGTVEKIKMKFSSYYSVMDIRLLEAVLWNRNRNRNRRNRNFLTSGSGTGTRCKIMYLIPSFNIFLFTFYKKYVEIYKLFPCKTAYYVKGKKNFQIFFEKFPFLVLIWSWNRNRNRNFSKVGTGTGTITFQK
jgi:hypothetical protein